MLDAPFLEVSKIRRNFNLIWLEGIKIQKKTYIQLEIKNDGWNTLTVKIDLVCKSLLHFYCLNIGVL